MGRESSTWISVQGHPPPEFLVRPLIAHTVAITRFPPVASEAAVHERYRPGIEEEAEETLKLINS